MILKHAKVLEPVWYTLGTPSMIHGTRSFGITWELVQSSESWASTQTCQIGIYILNKNLLGWFVCIWKFEKSLSGEFHCAEIIKKNQPPILFYFWSERTMLLALLLRVNRAHLLLTRSSMPSCQEFKISHYGCIYTTKISKYFKSQSLPLLSAALPACQW